MDVLKPSSIPASPPDWIGHDGRCRTGGWIAPDGTWYRTPQEHHEEYAGYLGSQYYGCTLNGDSLIALGWVKIYDEGMPIHKRDAVTQAQIDTAYDLSMVPGVATDWRNELLQWIQRQTR